jgi:ABC-2 type transport system ATP-binding protein
VISLRGLSKRYGDKTAVDDLTFDIEPGRVTGFLGPNGAGKSTTMRLILGLDHPTAGQALIDGKRYDELRHPVREVGALLDGKAVHPGRSARNHLLAMARTHGIPAGRVDEVLEVVGLTAVANKRAGGFSLGMSQRLGMAGAMLGDPGILIFDEPVNGLDPDGVRWVRELVRSFAEEGRTVFVSSHLMSEMQQTAHQLVVLGRGRLIVDAPIEEVIAKSSFTSVRVRVPDAVSLEALTARLAEESTDVRPAGDDTLVVQGATVEWVGDLAHSMGIRLHELRTVEASLEQAYMELTAASVEFAAPAVGRSAGGHGDEGGAR